MEMNSLVNVDPENPGMVTHLNKALVSALHAIVHAILDPPPPRVSPLDGKTPIDPMCAVLEEIVASACVSHQEARVAVGHALRVFTRAGTDTLVAQCPVCTS